MNALLAHTDTSYVVLFTLMIPLFAAFLASITRSDRIRDVTTIGVGIALLFNVINLLLLARHGTIAPIELVEFLPGLTLRLDIEPLGLLFALVASSLWLITSIYSIGYMHGNKEHNQARFYTFFGIAIFATMGIAMAGNLLTLFLFYEMLTLSTYPLVTHHGDEIARKAGRVYLGILLATSIGLFLPGIIWVWQIAGTTDFTAGGVLLGKASPLMTGALLFLFAFGIGKAALMPLHRWLPAAMVAPTPVSALLHAVAVVKAGVFSILKIVLYIFGPDHLQHSISVDALAGEWLIWAACITLLLASCTALRQKNLKLMLAYSTVSQLSYIVLATAMLTPLSLTAAGFHIAAHAFGKITLFFAAGAIYTATKKTQIADLEGMGRRMPVTMAAFTIGALSMIGLPPMAGFLSKFYMLHSAFETSHTLIIFVLLLSTLLNAAYFLPILYSAFFKKYQPATPRKEAPISIMVALTITATTTLVLFLVPGVFLWLASLAGGGGVS